MALKKFDALLHGKTRKLARFAVLLVLNMIPNFHFSPFLTFSALSAIYPSAHTNSLDLKRKFSSQFD